MIARRTARPFPPADKMEILAEYNAYERIVCHGVFQAESRPLFAQNRFERLVEIQGLQVDGIASWNHDDTLADEIGGEGELDLRLTTEARHRFALFDNR